MYLTKNKKSPYYQIIYFPKGKRTTITTKKKSKSEALEFLINFKRHLESKKVNKKKISYQEFKVRYFNYCESIKSQKYFQSIQLSLNIFESYLPKAIQLKDVDSFLIDEFIAKHKVSAPRGVNVYIRTLKASFNKAKNWKYIDANPFDNVKLLKIPTNNDCVISKEQLKIINLKCSNETISNLINVTYDTGMRLQEAVNLRVNSLDMSNKIIHVRNHRDFNIKSKRQRNIPMTNKVYEILYKDISAKKISGDDYVFGKSSKMKYNHDYISKYFKKLLRNCNFDENLHFHSLRHSFCSNLAKNGVDLRTIMELAGHVDFSTTLRYSHLKNEDLVKAIEKL